MLANHRAALWLVGSCLSATGMSMCVRFVGPEIGSLQTAFLRSVLGVWVLIPIFVTGKHRTVRYTRPGLHILRGLLFVGAVNCGFYALSTLNLSTATTLFFLAPIFATAFAALFQGEQVGPRRWLAVFAGFIGALIVLQPGFTTFEWGMAAAIGSSLLFSIALLISKPLAEADGAESILISATVIAVITMFPLVSLNWKPVEGTQWAILLALAVFSTGRMYMDIKAYSKGEAGFLAPFAYLRLIFVAIFAYLIFQQVPPKATLLGAAVIIASTVYIARREMQLNKAGRKVSAGP